MQMKPYVKPHALQFGVFQHRIKAALVRLFKGHATVVGRRSEDSALYDLSLATYDTGDLFDQSLADELAAGDGFSLLCGRYEGVDHRVVEHLVDGEVSVGDVVLSGGEVAACLVIEAVARLLPGAMGNSASPVTESFGASGLLEEPQYTRPADFRGWTVPDVLLSGDHGRIERWRLAQAVHRTLRVRPDLIEARGGLSDQEQRLLEEFPAVPYP
ncbi:MAG: hypothetical protein EBS22_04950 [Acidimicrobiia bacterium]|nr:hypothetical protein [Acidimicrobiia bacterium]